MPFPMSNNPYNFDAYLEWRNGVDYYRDDHFFQTVVRYFTGSLWEKVNRTAHDISPKVSFRWRDLADRAALTERRPFVQHYDGHNHRIDRIVRPMETMTMEKEVFAEALFSSCVHPWEKLVKMFLIYQNGEACISCPLTCTEGLVALVEQYADSSQLRHVLTHCREGIEGDFAIGAQYLSEIQGGSDVSANLLEAVLVGDAWRLYGTKFFCSASHADYALVTAKAAGSEKVAIFLVPSWLPGDKAKEKRNGFTIDRIKWKMGTSELTTGELTFNGALAYPVGPLERGIANVVGIVLTRSRLTVGLSGAASMTRAVREAKKYAEFREAFGRPISQYPMVASQLKEMERKAKRTTAATFKLYQSFLKLQNGNADTPSESDAVESRKQGFDVRELIMFQKIVVSSDAVDVLRMAMSIFGGHGVMEDFSALPRLYRDAAVNELWEGPRNVLLTQIFRDFQKAADWYKPAEFVSRVLGGADQDTVELLSQNLSEILDGTDLGLMDVETISKCRQWELWCHDFFHSFQEMALDEVERYAEGSFS